MLSPLLTVAPALAAFVMALGLLQVTPGVQAANNAPTPVIKPLPILAAAYPEKYIVTRTMKVAAPIKFGDWAWNETSAPLTGPVLVTVDTESQLLAVFRDGYEIGATAVLTGIGDKPAPLGVYPITQKNKDHVSNLYDAPMPYMLRMTSDGISIHGSDMVEPIYATNGCIGIPTGFAKRLFEIVALGDRIVVTRAIDLRAGDVIPTT